MTMANKAITALIGTYVFAAMLGGCTNTGEVTFIKNGIVIDGTGGPVRDHTSIRVKDGRIDAIGSDLKVPKRATVIDATGQTVLPGFFDMHGHLYGRGADQTLPQHETFAKLYLAGGVTSIFSPGSRDPEGALAIRDRIEAGDMAGPRIHLAGRYIDHKPSAVSWIDGFESSTAAIDYIDGAVDGIVAVKLYAGVDHQFAKSVIGAAHARDLFVTGHIGNMTASEAINAGIDGLEHGVFTIKEISGSDDLAEQICNLSRTEIDTQTVSGIINLLRDNNVYLTPTTVIFAALKSDPSLFPYDWRRFLSDKAKLTWADLAKSVMALPPEVSECLDGAIATQLAFIGKAHEAGIRILTGTDPISPAVTPGYGLQLEIQFLMKAGLSIEEAIRAASLDAAEVLHVNDGLGSLEPGKVADILIVDGDVRRDSSALLKSVRVFKGGVAYDPEILRKAAEGGIQ